MAHEHQFDGGAVEGERGDDRDSGVAQVTFRVTSYVVLWLWSVLRYRSEADRWHVLLACWAGLVDTASPRVAAHLQVAMRFRDDTGGQVVPSRRPYNRWRDQQPDRDELPSASALARTFGGWPAVAEAVGMNVAPDVLARRVTQNGRRLSKTELVTVLRLWRQSNPPELTYRRYRVWAQAANHDPGRPVAWVPVSRGIFIQHFGGWADALHAAGLIDDEQLALARADQIAPHERKIDEQVILTALRDAAAAHPDARLTAALYLTWRNRQIDAGGRPAPPHLTTVQQRMGSWHEALLAAGLIDEAQSTAGLRKGGRRVPDRQVMRCLTTAVRAVGPDITRRQYRRWRERQLAVGVRPMPVSDAAIVNRFGGWPKAVDAAIEVLKTTNTQSKEDEIMASHHEGRSRRERERSAALERAARREQVLDDLRAAMETLPPGQPLTIHAYLRWREQHLADRWPPPVAVSSIRRRFGNWSEAVRLARGDDDAQAATA
jgi:hypothetical protein